MMNNADTTFAEVMDRVRQVNKDNGWDDMPTEKGPELRRWVFEKLLLVTTEIAEGAEELRKGKAPDEAYLSYPPVPTSLAVEFSSGAAATEAWQAEQVGKPEGLPSELADAVIRLMHLADMLEIDLLAHILGKLDYNSTRGFRHGKHA